MIIQRPSPPMQQAGFLRILVGGLSTDTAMPAVLNACSVFEKQSVANKWRTLGEVMSSGASFGDSIASFPELLPPEAVALANIGLSRQQLAAAYQRLATSIADENAGSKAESTTNDATIGTVTLYAAAYFIVVASLFTFLHVFILPKYKAIFKGFGISFPSGSAASAVMSDPSLLVSISTGFVLFSMSWLITTCLVYTRVWGSGLSPSDPAFWWARFFPRTYAPNILRLFGEVVESRLPIAGAVACLVQLPIFPAIRDSLSKVDAAMQSGEDIWLSLRNERLINSREVQLLTLATQLGNVRATAFEVASMIEMRRRHRCQLLYQLYSIAIVLVMIIPVVILASVFFEPVFYFKLITQNPENRQEHLHEIGQNWQIGRYRICSRWDKL